VFNLIVLIVVWRNITSISCTQNFLLRELQATLILLVLVVGGRVAYKSTKYIIPINLQVVLLIIL